MRSARNFASRVSSELQLADSEDVVEWCAKATHGIIKDKSTLVARTNVERLIQTLAHNAFDLRVVHSTWGYDMTHNTYALVIKETKRAALLLSIRNKTISADEQGTEGSNNASGFVSLWRRPPYSAVHAGVRDFLQLLAVSQDRRPMGVF